MRRYSSASTAADHVRRRAAPRRAVPVARARPFDTVPLHAPATPAIRGMGRHDLCRDGRARLHRLQPGAGARRRRCARPRRRRARAHARRARRPARRCRGRVGCWSHRSPTRQVADVVDGCDVVFNVAGQVSHTASMRDPQQDLALNTTSHAHVARDHPSRAAHGAASSTRRRARCTGARRCRRSTRPTPPARSTSTASPSWPANNSISCTATPTASPTTALRLTNVYGPRQRLSSDELGFLPVFVRKALLGEPIEIFGDGTQRRDCLHVADVLDRTRRRGDARATRSCVQRRPPRDAHRRRDRRGGRRRRWQHGRRAPRRVARRHGPASTSARSTPGALASPPPSAGGRRSICVKGCATRSPSIGSTRGTCRRREPPRGALRRRLRRGRRADRPPRLVPARP